MSKVKHTELSEQGKERIAWVSEHMPVLRGIGEWFEKKKPLKGLNVGMCLHVEPKTCVLALTLKKAGADVAIAGCNPLSTQDDAASALSKMGVEVFAWHGQNEEEYSENINKVIDSKPNILIDDGADVIAMLHEKRTDALPELIGACEETTTGISRIKAMEKDGVLTFPVMAVNEAYTKHMFDNRYGTGQSVIDGILKATNLSLAGKTATVAGYGWCGKGVAARLSGMGCNIIVTELDSIKALEAKMDGYRVMKIEKALEESDIVVTVTGNKHVIGKGHISHIKNGAILANAGHFDIEIDKQALAKESVRQRQAKDEVEAYELKNGRKVYLLSQGRLVNLAAGQGHPAEIMDMSFAVQAMSAEYLSKERNALKPKVYPIPIEIDRAIADLKLKAMGVEIDELTNDQAQYLKSWRI